MDIPLPPGLDRAILQSILKFHVGRENAIPRPAMLKQLGQLGFHVDDRVMRACINELRKRGFMICSAGGNGGGYFSPASHAELQDYIDRELHPRAVDLLEQEKAMRAAADKQWGYIAHQMTMGGIR